MPEKKSSNHYMIAFSLGAMITGYIMFFLGQTWNREDMALLHSHIHNMKVEQNRARRAAKTGNMEQPKERASASVRKKVMNEYYKMEKTSGKVPGLPPSMPSTSNGNNNSGGKK